MWGIKVVAAASRDLRIPRLPRRSEGREALPPAETAAKPPAEGEAAWKCRVQECSGSPKAFAGWSQSLGGQRRQLEDQEGAAPIRKGTSPKGSRWYARETRWYPSAMSPPSPVETTSTGLSRLPETALSRSRRTPASSKGNATRLQARKMSLARRRVTTALRRRPTAAAACFSSNFNDRYADAASKSWAATSSSQCKPSDSLPGGLVPPFAFLFCPLPSVFSLPWLGPLLGSDPPSSSTAPLPFLSSPTDLGLSLSKCRIAARGQQVDRWLQAQDRRRPTKR